MALESTITKNVYLGDGAATDFPFSFKVWKASQLEVVITSPDGLSSLASGWSANLSPTGGTVTYRHAGAALEAGWKLAITRKMPFTQGVNLISGTRFDPEVIETALDTATAERQQLLEKLDRAIAVEATSSTTPAELLQSIYDSRDEAKDAAAFAGTSASVSTAQAEAAAAAAAEARALVDGARDTINEAASTAIETSRETIQAKADEVAGAIDAKVLNAETAIQNKVDTANAEISTSVASAESELQVKVEEALANIDSAADAAVGKAVDTAVNAAEGILQDKVTASVEAIQAQTDAAIGAISDLAQASEATISSHAEAATREISNLVQENEASIRNQADTATRVISDLVQANEATIGEYAEKATRAAAIATESADRSESYVENVWDAVRLAEAAASEAVAVSNLGLATKDKAGLVKPDETTITVYADGTLSAAPLNNDYARRLTELSAQYIRLSTRVAALECGMGVVGGGVGTGAGMTPSGYLLPDGSQVVPVTMVPDGQEAPDNSALAVIVDGLDSAEAPGSGDGVYSGASGYPLPDGSRVAPVTLVPEGNKTPEDAALAVIVANPEQSGSE